MSRRYTPSDLITLAAGAGGIARVTAAGTDSNGARLVKIEGQGKAWADSHPIGGLAWSADPRLNSGTITEQTITQEEWYARQVIAASIMLAGAGVRGEITNGTLQRLEESMLNAWSADPRARRLKGAGAGGSNVAAGGFSTMPNLPASTVVCRGLWQFSSAAWSIIPDAVAYDAQMATAAAFAITDGFRPDRFAEWAGSAGLDPASEQRKIVAAALTKQRGHATDMGILGIPGEAALYDAIEETILTPLEWAAALGRLLSTLLDPAWWKRIGIGALGVLIILAVFIGARAAGTE